jgi:hypothetical protein
MTLTLLPTNPQRKSSPYGSLRHLWRQPRFQGIDAAVDDILRIAHVPRVRVAQRPVQSRPVWALHPRQHVALLVLQTTGEP